jgi:hypothetical protein
MAIIIFRGVYLFRNLELEGGTDQASQVCESCALTLLPSSNVDRQAQRATS